MFSYLSHQLPIGRTEGYDPACPKDKQIYEMIENKIEEESQQVNIATCWSAQREGGETLARARRRRRWTRGSRWRGSRQGSPCAGCTNQPPSSSEGCWEPTSPEGSRPEM